MANSKTAKSMGLYSCETADEEQEIFENRIDSCLDIIFSVTLQEVTALVSEISYRYVMDELGSALRHSDEPNFRTAPFLYMRDGNLASAVRFSLNNILLFFPGIIIYIL